MGFAIPLGSLDRGEPRIKAYPFDECANSLAWKRPIDDWLAGIARRVYAAVRFPFAIVGFEMLAELCAADFASRLPAVRSDGFLFETPEGLSYHPATHEYSEA